MFLFLILYSAVHAAAAAAAATASAACTVRLRVAGFFSQLSCLLLLALQLAALESAQPIGQQVALCGSFCK